MYFSPYASVPLCATGLHSLVMDETIIGSLESDEAVELWRLSHEPTLQAARGKEPATYVNASPRQMRLVDKLTSKLTRRKVIVSFPPTRGKACQQKRLANDTVQGFMRSALLLYARLENKCIDDDLTFFLKRGRLGQTLYLDGQRTKTYFLGARAFKQMHHKLALGLYYYFSEKHMVGWAEAIEKTMKKYSGSRWAWDPSLHSLHRMSLEEFEDLGGKALQQAKKTGKTIYFLGSITEKNGTINSRLSFSTILSPQQRKGNFFKVGLQWNGNSWTIVSQAGNLVEAVVLNLVNSNKAQIDHLASFGKVYKLEDMTSIDEFMAMTPARHDDALYHFFNRRPIEGDELFVGTENISGPGSRDKIIFSFREKRPSHNVYEKYSYAHLVYKNGEWKINLLFDPKNIGLEKATRSTFDIKPQTSWRDQYADLKQTLLEKNSSCSRPITWIEGLLTEMNPGVLQKSEFDIAGHKIKLAGYWAEEDQLGYMQSMASITELGPKPFLSVKIYYKNSKLVCRILLIPTEDGMKVVTNKHLHFYKNHNFDICLFEASVQRLFACYQPKRENQSLRIATGAEQKGCIGIFHLTPLFYRKHFAESGNHLEATKKTVEEVARLSGGHPRDYLNTVIEHLKRAHGYKTFGLYTAYLIYEHWKQQGLDVLAVFNNLQSQDFSYSECKRRIKEKTLNLSLPKGRFHKNKISPYIGIILFYGQDFIDKRDIASFDSLKRDNLLPSDFHDISSFEDAFLDGLDL